MEWMNLLQEIWDLCVVPLLGILTIYLVNYIKAKNQELVNKSENELVDKYSTMLSQTIVDCVIATKQTYVDSLKKENLFDEEAQKEAFNRTLEAVLSILTDEAKEYLATAYGDLTVYLQQKIEAEVNKNK